MGGTEDSCLQLVTEWRYTLIVFLLFLMCFVVYLFLHIRWNVWLDEVIVLCINFYFFYLSFIYQVVAISEVLQQVTAPRAVAAATGNTHLAAFDVLS